MNFLAHRGLWQRDEDKNTRRAFGQAFQAGLGVEIDIRDLNGELVVSHDMPRKGVLSFATVLGDYVNAGRPATLAINIKSDGLSAALHYLLHFHQVTDYFCFDMSIPDTLAYRDLQMPFAARLSEYEPEGALSNCASSLWWDAFRERIVPADRLERWLSAEKRVCLVSPELHKRAPEPFWQQLAALPADIRNHHNLMLCTDYPAEAERALS